MAGRETYGEPCPKCLNENTNLEEYTHVNESIFYCFECGYGAFSEDEKLKNDWFIPTMYCVDCNMGVQWWVVKRVGNGNYNSVKVGDIHCKCYRCEKEFTNQDNIPELVKKESLKWFEDN